MSIRTGQVPVPRLPADARSLIWRIVQGVLSLGLSAALLGWLLPSITHTTWGEIWRTITGIGWPAFCGLFSLMIIGLYCYTFTLSGSLPGLSHIRALTANLAGSSVSNVLPAGGAFGTALNYAMFRSWGFSHTQITSSVIVTTVWNVLARALLPVLAALILLPFPDRLPGAIWSGAVLGGVAGGVAVLALIALLASREWAARIGELLERVLRKVRPNSQLQPVKTVIRLRGQMIGLVSTRWGHLTFGLAGFFGVYFVLFSACLRLSGVDVPWRVMFAAYAVGRLLTAVPVTPGGLGVAEAGAATVLVALGADPAATGAAVALFALFSHLLEIPCGAIAAVLWMLLRPEPGEEDAPGTGTADGQPAVAGATAAAPATRKGSSAADAGEPVGERGPDPAGQ